MIEIYLRHHTYIQGFSATFNPLPETNYSEYKNDTQILLVSYASSRLECECEGKYFKGEHRFPSPKPDPYGVVGTR